MAKKISAIGIVAAVLVSAQSMAAQDDATSASDRDEYRPPTGFGSYAWGTPLGEFRRLMPDPVYVRIAHSPGTPVNFDIDCFHDGSPVSVCSEIVDDGFHALAEYYVDGQGFRITDPRNVRTVIFPISYQFCARWRGFSNKLQGDALQQLKLCGVRLAFRSDNAKEEAANKDPEYVTPARRVLNWLIANHGVPEKYRRSGKVTVVGFDDPESDPERRDRHENWYWCRTKVDDLVPTCDASIVYTFDSESGQGQVLMLTPPVWLYAHARRFGGSEDDPLYRLLHGNIQLASVRRTCTGTFICDPPRPKPMSEAELAKFRVPANVPAAR